MHLIASIAPARLVSALLAGCCVSAAAAGPSLTIYNQQFGVVRDNLRLELKRGLNEVVVSNLTAHVEPSSVVLRDPTGQHQLRVLEQNYRADPLSQGLLLNRFEGQVISFLQESAPPQPPRLVRGRILRSGYVPHGSALQRYGQQYALSQYAMASPNGAGTPVVEVDGVVRFGLPGIPLFPSLGEDTVLQPTLEWRLETDQPGRVDAEISYLTGGMSWEADYNAVASGTSDVLELVGWVTMDNQSGRTFPEARIQLMAGDVSRAQPEGPTPMMRRYGLMASGPMPPDEVTERAFDEYHLYSLPRPTTLRDRETKQVEFVRAAGVTSRRLYLYDGVDIDPRRYGGWGPDTIRQNSEYGTESHPKVTVVREFENSDANGLGIPLPRGRVRFYRRDEDNSLQFTGENFLDHTPQGETVRITTGNAFDLVGERKRTNFLLDHARSRLTESFEIRLRNRKSEPAEIRVVEHLYRWVTWEIAERSHPFTKTDARTIEFQVTVAPDAEQIITYQALYTW